jgi:hypothetical protein
MDAVLSSCVRVAQVAHLPKDSKDVSGCSTASYDISFLVRNEEARDNLQLPTPGHCGAE